MNTIISCIVAMAGGAFGIALPVLVFLPVLTPARYKPLSRSVIGSVTYYSLICGAVLGLIVVLGSGQRL